MSTLYIQVTPEGTVTVYKDGKIIDETHPARDQVIVELTIEGDITEFRLGGAE